MKFAIQIALLSVILAGCKKDKVGEEKPPVTPAVSKWALISGNYKVYDTLGAYMYDMSISHSKGQAEAGYKTDSLHFFNFDDNFNFSAVQGGGCSVNCLWIGSHDAVVGCAG